MQHWSSDLEMISRMRESVSLSFFFLTAVAAATTRTTILQGPKYVRDRQLKGRLQRTFCSLGEVGVPNMSPLFLFTALSY